jgi:hypothetical protein
MSEQARRAARIAAAAMALMLALSTIVAAGVKIKVMHRDKEFNFGAVRTWAWHPDGAGDVKMVLTADDDPVKMRERVEPTIKQAVEEALTSRGLSMLTNGQTPQLYVTYYVLLSTGANAETAQYFGATTPNWALPEVAEQTTNLRFLEQGSLVLDISSTANKTVIWRGVAQAEIDRSRSEEERRARIQQAIKDLIKKLPKD